MLLQKIILFSILLNLNFTFGQTLSVNYNKCDSLKLYKFYGNDSEVVFKTKIKPPLQKIKINFYETGYYFLSIDTIKTQQFILSINEKTNITVNGDQIKVDNSIENQTIQSLKQEITYKKDRIQNLRTLINLTPDKTKLYSDAIQDIKTSTIKELSNRLDSNYSYALESSLCYLRQQFKTQDSIFYQNIPLKNSFLNSSLYPNLIMMYFERHTEYNENGFKTAIDEIMNYTSKNQKIYHYHLEFLLNLFDNVGPKIIHDYIIEKYIIENGCEEENSLIPKETLSKYLNLRIGSQIADFKLINTSVYSEASNYQNTILFFGSDYCPFCQDIKPELERLAKIYKAKVIYFSLSESKNEIIDENWTYYNELKGWKSLFIDEYIITKTPTIYLINSHAVIKAKNPKLVELEPLLKP